MEYASDICLNRSALPAEDEEEDVALATSGWVCMQSCRYAVLISSWVAVCGIPRVS